MTARTCILFVIFAAAGACRGPAAGPAPDAAGPGSVCPPAHGHWPHYACARVEGTVVGARGQPLESVTVGARHHHPTSERGMYSTSYDDTDAAGGFRFGFTRVQPAHPDHAADPDTVSMYVVAAASGSQYPRPDHPYVIRDSVLVPIHFGAVGAPVPVTRVRITLPIP